MLHCRLLWVDVSACHHRCSLLRLLSVGCQLSSSLSSVLCLTRLLPWLRDPWMLLERMLLHDTGLLWWSDRSWTGAHLNRRAWTLSHSYSSRRWMSCVLVGVHCTCWSVDGEALVLEMRGWSHVVGSGSGLCHCPLLGLLLIMLLLGMLLGLLNSGQRLLLSDHLLLLRELELTLLLNYRLLLRHCHGVHAGLWGTGCDADGSIWLPICLHLHRHPRGTRLSGLLHEVCLCVRHGW